MLNKAKIRRIIREVLSERSRQEWERDYGKVLFGDQRGSSERNTPTEDDLVDMLSNWYQGDLSYLSKDSIETMRQMQRDGMYSDVVDPPDTQYVYRFITVEPNQPHIGAYRSRVIQTANLAKPSLDQAKWLDDDSIVVVEKVGPIVIGVRKNRNYGGPHVHGASWTIDPNVIRKIKSDWGTLGSPASRRTKLIIMRAPMQQNRQAFIMNPNNTVELSEPYAYQREVIQVGSVAGVIGVSYSLMKYRGGKLIPHGSWSRDGLENYALDTFQSFLDM